MSELFTIITVPSFDSGYVPNLIQWFRAEPKTSHKLLLDNQCLTQSLMLEQVHALYPGIKTIGVVTDPWDRMINAYSKYRGTRALSFDTFIENLDKFQNLTIPQTRYLQYSDNGNTVTADFIFKNENLVEEFKILQKFFNSSIALEGIAPPKTAIYRKFYSAKTRKIVEDLFHEDIENFGYRFD